METTESKGTLYFMKLQANHFQRKEVRILESMTNGALYSLFYLKLCLESLADNGYLRLTDEIPYNPEMLAGMTNTNVDIVRGALQACEALGLIQILEDATIYIKEVEAITGQIADNPNAERQRRFKAKKKAEKAALQSHEMGKIESVTKSNAEVTPSVTKSNVEYRYLDNRYLDSRKEKEKEREKKSGANAPDNTHTEEQPKKKTKKLSCAAPEYSEVKEYIHARGDLISAERFYNYYMSLGWPLADWRARVLYWEATQKERESTGTLPLPPLGYMEREVTPEELAGLVSDPEKDLQEILEGVT